MHECISKLQTSPITHPIHRLPAFNRVLCTRDQQFSDRRRKPLQMNPLATNASECNNALNHNRGPGNKHNKRIGDVVSHTHPSDQPHASRVTSERRDVVCAEEGRERERWRGSANHAIRLMRRTEPSMTDCESLGLTN
jgi:hypothetical protein